MANDYRILDERDIKNFQAGNKLNVTEIGNKVTYEHIGEPPDRLPSKEQALEYGKSFDITVPSVYDSTGHVKSETTYSFKMPDKVDTSSGLTADNFAANTPIRVNKNGNNITYSHDTSSIDNTTTTIGPNVNNTISLTALSAADDYGHATEKTTYQFQIPNISNFLTTNNFSSESPIHIKKDGKNVTYSHDEVSMTTIIPESATQLTYGGTFEIPALSAADGYGHATETTTYKFQMPTAVNVSGYIKKDSFGDIENNPVSKKEENNKIIYYHDNKTITTPTPEPATELEYDKEFSFTALSAADNYGHANQKTTYKFKMPKAPTTSSINTSDFLKKTDFGATFKADVPLKATIDSGKNTVTYSHNKPTVDTSLKTDGPPKTGDDVNISLSYGNTTSFTALSGIDEYGHAIQKTEYNIKMPAAPTIKTNVITIYANTFTGDKFGSLYQWTTSPLNIDIGSFTGLYVTLYPNATGVNIGSGYDSDDSKTMVNVRLLLPGSITFFAKSPDEHSQVSFLIPRLYILTPTTNSYHGFSYTPTGKLKCIIDFSTDHSTITGLTLTCDQQYVKPTFIDKIIITAY